MVGGEPVARHCPSPESWPSACGRSRSAEPPLTAGRDPSRAAGDLRRARDPGPADRAGRGWPGCPAGHDRRTPGRGAGPRRGRRGGQRAVRRPARQRLAPAEVVVAVAARPGEAAEVTVPVGYRGAGRPGRPGRDGSRRSPMTRPYLTGWAGPWVAQAATRASSPWAVPWPAGREHGGSYLLDLACARECSQADAVGHAGAGLRVRGLAGAGDWPGASSSARTAPPSGLRLFFSQPKELSALTTRALVYGDIDLNLIDGSAIWLQSVTQALAGRGLRGDTGAQGAGPDQPPDRAAAGRAGCHRAQAASRSTCSRVPARCRASAAP